MTTRTALPPDGVCLACLRGGPLPGIVGCPNPSCYKHPGPRLWVLRDRPMLGGGNRPVPVAHRAAWCASLPTGEGWRWERV